MSELRIKFRPNEVCDMLSTGYHEFESSTGINGLAKITGSTLSLLAVNATAKRTGQFRKFITQAKRKFKTIEILEVWNIGLRDVLRRYGFSEDGDSFRWSGLDSGEGID